jgi:hypothetical protein
MADEAPIVPAEESKETPVESQPEEKELTAGEVFANEEVPAPVKEPKMVPEAVLIEYKKDAKDLKKQVEELKDIIKSGQSRGQVSEDVRQLADEFGITEDAVESLIKKVGEITNKDVEEKLRPLQEKERAMNADKTFNEHFEKLMESMPEYKDIANRDIIKTLSLDPRNSNKSFGKIIEEAYGHLVVGKKTLETTQARGGNSDAPIDFQRAVKDVEYYKELMSNPELKKKYNEHMLSNLKI